MTDLSLHFLRPWWFLALIPLFILFFFLWRKKTTLGAWGEVCDAHLLGHLVSRQEEHRGKSYLLILFFSACFMILSLTGPAWHKLPVPTYKAMQAHVLVLDLSEKMMEQDLTPNRLSRAKFKLHDLFSHKDVGQFGLVVFTGEPFVVSPLTDDGQTINSLLSTLNPEIMPVGGNKLDSALVEASHLIQQAGYEQGQILVLTATTPTSMAISTAGQLREKGIFSSIMPMRADKDLNPLYQSFAKAGGGNLLPYTSDATNLDEWLASGAKNQLVSNKDHDIPLLRDEGLWFLIPALLFLLPVFQRGWLQRMT